MITLPSMLAVLVATLAMEQQTAPAAPEPAAAPIEEPAGEPTGRDGPLTWESLPESLRSRLDAMVGTSIPQAAVVVDAPATGDAQARRVDHGTIVSEQTVRPAAFATIITPARNARRYGPAGALLWRGVSDAGDWWCWRNDEGFPDWRRPSSIYCYRDADGDGQFDEVMENTGVNGGFVSESRYQFRSLGREESVRGAVTYQLGAAASDMERYAEKVVVRYDGPLSGRVHPDGRLVDGEIAFDLLTGTGVATVAAPRRGNALIRVIPEPPDDGLTEIDRLVVTLDAEGRGRLSDARGIVLEVDRVDIDGSAEIRLISGLSSGETLLFPPLTRESVLEMILALMN